MGLFARLAGNALSPESGLRPAGLSRFAAAPEIEWNSEESLAAVPSPGRASADDHDPQSAERTVSSTADQERVARVRLDPPLVGRADDSREPGREPHDAVGPRTVGRTDGPAHEARHSSPGAQQRGEPRPTAAEAAPAALPPRRESEANTSPSRRPGAPEPVATTERARPTAWRDTELIPQSARRREREHSAPPPREPAAPSPEETTVTVSIGRVEVRAAQREPQSKPRSWTEGPLLTLSEYVRRRGEGSR